MNFELAKEFVQNRLETELPSNLYYHGLHHTKDVCNAAEHLAKLEKVQGEDLVMLRTAAWYHDVGFTVQYAKNEPIAANIARENLPSFGYSVEQIDIICGCILATEVPQQPKNHLEKILCDADLDYLGREDFYMIAQSLRREWIENGIFTSSLRRWYELQYKFMSGHRYHTVSAMALRQQTKLLHITELKELLNLME
jgi:predicted metal-dependent HD superfamily phosphohydrolase